MHTQFWLQRWREGRIGFHDEKVSPLLEKCWRSLSLPQESRILVPLCGKSNDMLWLAKQGYRVLGVEVSALAVEQFFTENRLQPEVRNSPAGTHFVAGRLHVICGDLFELQDQDLADCTGVYDRAALVALPADMRRRYAEHISRCLPEQSQMLLITVDYDQNEMPGPPFAVGTDEVDSLYAENWQITRLDEYDILSEEPRFVAQGLSALNTAAYRLQRKPRDMAGFSVTQ